jgi:hypothetical protein
MAPETRLRCFAERRERSAKMGAILEASKTLSDPDHHRQASCQDSALSKTTEPTICNVKRGMVWNAAMICCWTADAT